MQKITITSKKIKWLFLLMVMCLLNIALASYVGYLKYSIPMSPSLIGNVVWLTLGIPLIFVSAIYLWQKSRQRKINFNKWLVCALLVVSAITSKSAYSTYQQLKQIHPYYQKILFAFNLTPEQADIILDFRDMLPRDADLSAFGIFADLLEKRRTLYDEVNTAYDERSSMFNKVSKYEDISYLAAAPLTQQVREREYTMLKQALKKSTRKLIAFEELFYQYVYDLQLKAELQRKLIELYEDKNKEKLLLTNNTFKVQAEELLEILDAVGEKIDFLIENKGQYFSDAADNKVKFHDEKLHAQYKSILAKINSYEDSNRILDQIYDFRQHCENDFQFSRRCHHLAKRIIQQHDHYNLRSFPEHGLILSALNLTPTALVEILNQFTVIDSKDSLEKYGKLTEMVRARSEAYQSIKSLRPKQLKTSKQLQKILNNASSGVSIVSSKEKKRLLKLYEEQTQALLMEINTWENLFSRYLGKLDLLPEVKAALNDMYMFINHERLSVIALEIVALKQALKSIAYLDEYLEFHIKHRGKVNEDTKETLAVLNLKFHQDKNDFDFIQNIFHLIENCEGSLNHQLANNCKQQFNTAIAYLGAPKLHTQYNDLLHNFNLSKQAFETVLDQYAAIDSKSDLKKYGIFADMLEHRVELHKKVTRLLDEVLAARKQYAKLNESNAPSKLLDQQYQNLLEKTKALLAAMKEWEDVFYQHLYTLNLTSEQEQALIEIYLAANQQYLLVNAIAKVNLQIPFMLVDELAESIDGFTKPVNNVYSFAEEIDSYNNFIYFSRTCLDQFKLRATNQCYVRLDYLENSQEPYAFLYTQQQYSKLLAKFKLTPSQLSTIFNMNALNTTRAGGYGYFTYMVEYRTRAHKKAIDAYTRLQSAGKKVSDLLKNNTKAGEAIAEYTKLNKEFIFALGDWQNSFSKYINNTDFSEELQDFILELYEGANKKQFQIISTVEQSFMNIAEALQSEQMYQKINQISDEMEIVKVYLRCPSAFNMNFSQQCKKLHDETTL
jgi:hypothetical protein